MAIIEMKNLTKNYGRARAIDGLSLSINEGEFFGFIGPDGAGKTTVVRTLLGLISPTAGQVRIFEKDIVKQKKEILRNVGYMPAKVSFYDNMKVGELISFSAKMRGKDCSDEAEKLCQRFSVNLKWRVNELTLNGRKKAAIICAFQHSPQLYILDEPAMGLDPSAQEEFFKMLRERHSEGATILLATKVLSEVQKNCSRAAIMKEGKLAAVDDVKNMAESGARRITLYGISSVPELSGIESAEIAENYVSFYYSGDLKGLLRIAADWPIYDISIGEQELDELFMGCYEVNKERV